MNEESPSTVDEAIERVTELESELEASSDATTASMSRGFGLRHAAPMQ